MLRVPSDELSFAWDHRRPPHPKGKCVIKHNDRVVRRGNYTEMIELFQHITDTEETVAISYEDENGQRPEQHQRPEAPSAPTGGNGQ